MSYILVFSEKNIKNHMNWYNCYSIFQKIIKKIFENFQFRCRFKLFLRLICKQSPNMVFFVMVVQVHTRVALIKTVSASYVAALHS